MNFMGADSDQVASSSHRVSYPILVSHQGLMTRIIRRHEK
jgi:hypothetical protein